MNTTAAPNRFSHLLATRPWLLADGATGSNLDYVLNTVTHLGELGLRDRSLESLARAAAGGDGP